MVKYGSFHLPISRVYHSKTNPLTDRILSGALPPNLNQHSKAQPSPKGPWRARPKRCQASKVCILYFPIFQGAHLESSACNLPLHPKRSLSVESKVYGEET